MQPEPFRKGTSSNGSMQSMQLESRFHQNFLYTSTSDPKIYMEKQSNWNTQNNFGKDPFWRTHINLISNLCTNIVIKTVCSIGKTGRLLSVVSGTGESRNISTHHIMIIASQQRCSHFSGRRIAFSTNAIGVIRCPDAKI